MTAADRCEFCDGIVEHRQIRARFQFHGQTIYIDHVPRLGVYPLRGAVL